MIDQDLHTSCEPRGSQDAEDGDEEEEAREEEFGRRFRQVCARGTPAMIDKLISRVFEI